MIIENELEKELWDEMFSDAKQKKKVVRALSGIASMRHRLKKTLSDVFSTRRRAARDCLLDFLRYWMLLSKNSAMTTDQRRTMKRKVVVARHIFLRKVHGPEDIKVVW